MRNRKELQLRWPRLMLRYRSLVYTQAHLLFQLGIIFSYYFTDKLLRQPSFFFFLILSLLLKNKTQKGKQTKKKVLGLGFSSEGAQEGPSTQKALNLTSSAAKEF